MVYLRECMQIHECLVSGDVYILYSAETINFSMHGVWLWLLVEDWKLWHMTNANKIDARAYGCEQL